MSTTKTSAKNEKATSKVAPKATPVAKNETATHQKKMSGSTVDEILNPSASARIKKMENFQLLAKRFKFLTDKKDELDKFIISSDGTKEQIVLKNAEGFEFTVSNSQVVEEVVKVMQDKLSVFIGHSESEILNYNI